MSPTSHAASPAMIPALILLAIAAADDFDRLEGPALSGLVKPPDKDRRDSLSIADIGTLPNVLGGAKSPLIVVKTDEGNPARLLVAPAFRKPVGGQGEPAPVLVVERFDTFESGPATKKLAKGRDLMLFDGFCLDLDSGRIVPEGQGGDVRFVAGGEGGPRLVAVKGSTMFAPSKSPLGPPGEARRLSPGRTVLKSDFAGRYRLLANGQTSGRLDLEVDAAGVVSGRFRSDQTGEGYKVTGQAGSEASNSIRFAVDLPRARQEFVGRLFIEGKGAIAGSYDLLGREFGFVALREGGILTPDGEEVAAIPDGDASDRVMIDLAAGGATIDGKPADDEAIAAAVKGNPGARTLVRVARDVPADRVFKLMDVVRDAGATSIRIAPRPAK